MHVVRGKIRFQGHFGPARAVDLVISLVDTTYADAAAVPVAVLHTDLADWEITESEGLNFEIQADQLDPLNRYEIMVHLDFNCTGEIKEGDFINMQSYPVLTQGHPSEVKIKAIQIGSPQY